MHLKCKRYILYYFYRFNNPFVKYMVYLARKVKKKLRKRKYVDTDPRV